MSIQLPHKGQNKNRSRRSDLEGQAIRFTVGLYLFICTALLAVHYVAPLMPTAGSCQSSSSSPFNPCP
ncbi:hypothetical protein GCM10023065_20990 [Microbacterium laevaniformans]|uniref:hypothetical protein n=1 Tax=Microbacterium laevaniformans TaxID=36807 RepID=UPI00195749A0|nr:hypothetical protein [Microbacterium laevaniformans]MBM7753054.1 hypothetical protein [Microbacterium laevaniformans]GLJ65795.1 hypothetical protein GCM10017578_26850 [Microbacterium laevaniformans]